jgi:hypothetical protein
MLGLMKLSFGTVRITESPLWVDGVEKGLVIFGEQ